MNRTNLARQIRYLERGSIHFLAGMAAAALLWHHLYQTPLAHPIFLISMAALFSQAALSILKHFLQDQQEQVRFPAYDLLVAVLAAGAVALNYLPCGDFTQIGIVLAGVTTLSILFIIILRHGGKPNTGPERE